MRRRRKQREDDGAVSALLDVLLELSKTYPIAGIILSIGSFIGGCVLVGPARGLLYGFGFIFGVLLLCLAVMFLFVALVGFSKRLLSAAPTRSAFNVSPRAQHRQVYTPSTARIAAPPPLPSSAPIPRPVQPITTSGPFAQERPPYRRKSRLLSKGERAFYDVLVDVIRPEHSVFVKVRLSDLLHLPGDAPNRNFWNGKASQKHVDFVICDRANLEPLLIIELDDKSHQQPRRIKRDQFVNEVLRVANVKLLRVRCQMAYDVEELRASVANMLTQPLKR